MRRRLISMMTALAAVVAGAMASMVSAAYAQVGYPPGPASQGVPLTLPSVPPSVRASSSGIAFTGADILRWSLIALVLVGVGALLVVANRRRARLAA